MNRIPYFICIGTMRNKIDMVAPCIGSILRRAGFNVIGTEDDTVHALNVMRRISEIQNIDNRLYQVIGIDATIRTDKRAWINDNPIRPGSALRKELPSIGECGIRINVLNDIPISEQIEVIMEQHEQYENETRTLAAEVAHDIMNIYHYPYGRGNKRLRAIHNAKLILMGHTYREIASKEEYCKSTVANDVKRLQNINPELYIACMEAIGEQLKYRPMKAAYASWKSRERKKHEDTDKQCGIIGYSADIHILDDQITDTNS
jgi:putative sporulation protein YyaC